MSGICSRSFAKQVYRSSPVEMKSEFFIFK